MNVDHATIKRTMDELQDDGFYQLCAMIASLRKEAEEYTAVIEDNEKTIDALEAKIAELEPSGED